MRKRGENALVPFLSMAETDEHCAKWACTPLEACARWPRTRGLAMLCSCPGDASGSGNRARWSYLAEPTRVVTVAPDEPDPLAVLESEIQATRTAPDVRGAVPFSSGWIVALSYELGSILEPATGPAQPSPEWPWVIVLWQCPSVFAYDHPRRTWCNTGSNAQLEPGELACAGPIDLGPVAPLCDHATFERSVARAVEYTHAGDIFQVNLSHQLGGAFAGSARSLFGGLARASTPWYGAYLECPQGRSLHAALSLSPELYLEVDAASRAVTTRPIKGTRRAEVHPDALRESTKDQAELNMIVDLMRNDLGRICDPGSVRVANPRTIERHGGERSGVHHGVATVQGTLRHGASVADLLRATFPAGSITGAPKVRAMQIIRELEPAPRGLYTGAIGYISDRGNVSLNVAIRTAVVRGRRAPGHALDEIVDGHLTYGAGAGIVADSVPELEWQETLDKARVITDLSAMPVATLRSRRVHGVRA